MIVPVKGPRSFVNVPLPEGASVGEQVNIVNAVQAMLNLKKDHRELVLGLLSKGKSL